MPTLEAQKTAIQSIADSLPHDGELYFRPLFGGQAAYFNGRVFAWLTRTGLALKLPEKYREQLLEVGGQIVQFRPDLPVMSKYIFVPEELLFEHEKFEDWVGRSVAYVLELPAPKSSRRSRKKP